MKHWQQHVYQEKAELDHNIQKLLTFMSNPVFNTLDQAQQSLLKRKYEAMCNYSEVLTELTESFGP